MYDVFKPDIVNDHEPQKKATQNRNEAKIHGINFDVRLEY